MTREDVTKALAAEMPLAIQPLDLSSLNGQAGLIIVDECQKPTFAKGSDYRG